MWQVDWAAVYILLEIILFRKHLFGNWDKVLQVYIWEYKFGIFILQWSMRGHKPVNTHSVLGKFLLELASVELSSPDAGMSREHIYLRLSWYTWTSPHSKNQNWLGNATAKTCLCPCHLPGYFETWLLTIVCIVVICIDEWWRIYDVDNLFCWIL